MSFIRSIMNFGSRAHADTQQQQRGAPPAPAPQIETAPFPRHAALAKLTWDQCFAMDRTQIFRYFVQPLMRAPEVSKLAYLLSEMLKQPQGKAASTAILTTFPADVRKDPRAFPRIAPLDPTIRNSESIGSVHWSPTNAPDLHLYCHTSCDLLGALMTEASHVHSRSAVHRSRTKRNFYARIVALYSHWCVRLTGDARRPMKVGLAVVGDVTVLGSCIPDVPEKPRGKEVIRQARFQDLKRRGRHERSRRQILDVTKVDAMLWDYGNCAETWTFALLAVQSEAVLPTAFGVAVNVPQGRQVRRYEEAWERGRDRYAPLCVNCEKLMKQIVRWGKPGDRVVENFSVRHWVNMQ